MDVAAGLSAVKTGVELLNGFREGLKFGTVKPDEIAGRIGEILDYLIDAKQAIFLAQEEVASLKAENQELKNHNDMEDLLQFDGKVYWAWPSGELDGPFCPTCWDDRRKLIRLQHSEGRYDGKHGFYCVVERYNYTTNFPLHP